MNVYQLTHTSPPLCLDVPFDGTWGTLVRCSTTLEGVTCPKCWYYHFHPEARELEIEFRLKNVSNN